MRCNPFASAVQDVLAGKQTRRGKNKGVMNMCCSGMTVFVRITVALLRARGKRFVTENKSIGAKL